MVPSSQRSHSLGRRGWFAFAAVLAWAFLGATSAPAQDWKIYWGNTPTPPANGLERLALRPNARLPFFLFVEKSGNAQETDVLVRLLLVEAKKPARVLAERPVAVPDTKPVLVRLGEVKPEPKPEPGKAPAPPKPPEFVPLPGAPPYTLRAEVVAPKAKAGGMPLALQEVPVSLMAPPEYVQVTYLDYQIGERPEENRLRVELRALPGFHGSPCRVELVLAQELIPGLRRTKAGYLSRALEKALQTIELVAENVTFATEAPERGVVALTVDGYDRAFLYAVDFRRSNTQQQPKQVRSTIPSVRLLDDRTASVPVEKVNLHVLVDDAPSADVRLEVGVDRNRDGKYEEKLGEVIPLEGERQQLVSAALATPEGAVLFKTEVRYWQVPVETAGVFGKLPYRVRVLDQKGVPLVVRDQYNQQSKDGAVGYLVFDDTPPEDVRFPDPKGFPRELVRGDRLRVEATGEDPESDISQVAFFVGKPVKNKAGQLEPPPMTEPVKGAPLADKKGWWVAQLPGFDRIGIMYLTTQFVNGAGQSTFETIEIKLVDPAVPGAAAKKLFKISGTVVEGGRAQPGLDVVLRDDKGAPKGTTKTGKDPKNPGGYTFENVPPGVYSVSSAKVGSNTKGETPVTVEAADVKDVEISLFR